MNAGAAIERLRIICQDTGSVERWAKDNNRSPSYIRRVLGGEIKPSERLLNSIGMEWAAVELKGREERR